MVFNKRSNELKVENIPIHKIRPNPNQPRRYFDTLALDELSASIEEFGVIQPITLRRVFDGYEIVAGERRFRACESLGRSEVPAIVINADDEKSALIALLENLQREDLSFFEVAEGYKRLIHEQGMTQDELARRIGKSQSAIANKLRILRLSPRVRRLIHEFALTERHARAILHISDDEQQLALTQEICRKNLNVAQTEELVKSMLTLEKQKNQKVKISDACDMTLFANTVRKAVDTMVKKGINANIEQKEYPWGLKYTIKIKSDS